ncbi:tetratricopeptide repeat protein [Candidatus Ichthyocystis hellenicum]|uniref:tetratricopeptide repeat protein n=1 Tax=Candidatus Ichthyocystis hellenicum TaxID=1561003 RepID=UPI000B882335|nr:tetratricopeptide repeat protein [Candidatus Ichthyocystis hellenicum]
MHNNEENETLDRNSSSNDECSGDVPEDDGMAFLNHIFSGGTVSSFEGRSKESLDVMYFLAIRLYNSGKYSKAHPLFHELVRLNHTEQKYTFGLAACLHKMGHYINAANVYLSALLLNLDADNVEIYFHMAQCLISANQSLDQAKEYLCYVVEKCPCDGELGKLRSVAEAQLKLLNKDNDSEEEK